jgi:hypothetical protein
VRTMPLSPSLLIAAANALVGFGEDHPGRSRGRLVHCYLKEAGIAGGAATPEPWDTAFVHHVGYWSHYDQRSLRSSWPLPVSASCAELGAFAKREGVLAPHPLEGDLFLLWGPARKTFVRAGIVVRVEGTGRYLDGNLFHECVAIEGDTNEWGAPRGGRTLRHRRRLSSERGDGFVRWTALESGTRSLVAA